MSSELITELSRPTRAATRRVVCGAGRGRSLGFPTANLGVPWGGVRDGVYAAVVEIEGDPRRYGALANVGPCPTFGVGARNVEVHLLDFDGDLYGRRLRVELRVRLTGQRRCESPEALALRIGDLAARARRALTTDVAA